MLESNVEKLEFDTSYSKLYTFTGINFHTIKTILETEKQWK